ncbi:hypothetical protein AB0F03_09820 [Streptomyces sp. NPDC028722]|uniref:hypothetical protein n=1 Tax=Streptomyces sp. NPDC028722 TaxID=3155016 RepID=UPI0033E4481E
MPDTTALVADGSPPGGRVRPPGPPPPGTAPVPAAGGDAGPPARMAAPLAAAGTPVAAATSGAAERNMRKGISVFRPISATSVIGGAAGPRPATV